MRITYYNFFAAKDLIERKLLSWAAMTNMTPLWHPTFRRKATGRFCKGKALIIGNAGSQYF